MPNTQPRIVNQLKADKLAKPDGRHPLGDCLWVVTRTFDSGRTTRKYKFRYRVGKGSQFNNGKDFEITIGDYGSLKLAEAHRIADQYREMADSGTDPRKPAAPLTEPANGITVLQLFNDWVDYQLATKAQWKKNPEKSARDCRSRMRDYMAADCQNSAAESVRFKDIAEGIRKAWNSKIATEKFMHSLHQAFEWGIVTEKLARQDNPADMSRIRTLLGNPELVEGHQPACPADQIPELFLELSRRRLSVAAGMLAYSILTTARDGSITEAVHDELHAKGRMLVHVIPAARMKRKAGASNYLDDRETPVSSYAKRVLDGLPVLDGCSYLFPNIQRYGDPKPLDVAAMYTLIRRINADRAKAGLPLFVDPVEKDTKGKPREIRPHGTARATFKEWGSNAAKFGHDRIEDKLLERCLDHAEKYNGAYDRRYPLAEMLKVYEAWGHYCFSLIDQQNAKKE